MKESVGRVLVSSRFAYRMRHCLADCAKTIVRNAFQKATCTEGLGHRWRHMVGVISANRSNVIISSYQVSAILKYLSFTSMSGGASSTAGTAVVQTKYPTVLPLSRHLHCLYPIWHELLLIYPLLRCYSAWALSRVRVAESVEGGMV